MDSVEAWVGTVAVLSTNRLSLEEPALQFESVMVSSCSGFVHSSGSSWSADEFKCGQKH